MSPIFRPGSREHPPRHPSWPMVHRNRLASVGIVVVAIKTLKSGQFQYYTCRPYRVFVRSVQPLEMINWNLAFFAFASAGSYAHSVFGRFLQTWSWFWKNNHDGHISIASAPKFDRELIFKSIQICTVSNEDGAGAYLQSGFEAYPSRGIIFSLVEN